MKIVMCVFAVGRKNVVVKNGFKHYYLLPWRWKEDGKVYRPWQLRYEFFFSSHKHRF